MKHPRIIKLEAPRDRCIRFLTSLPADIGANKRRSIVTLTRAGSFTDPRYGRFEITLAMLHEMVRNFDAKVLGQDVFIDVSHRPEDGAAAKIVALSVEGSRLRADVEWTDFGLSAVQQRGFRYMSAEYHEDWKDNEAGKAHGTVLLGAGLTVRPVIKRLDPVELSESADRAGPVLLHPELVRQLAQELEHTMNKHLKKLIDRARAKGLSESQINQLTAAFTAATKHLAEADDDQAASIGTQFEGVVDSMAANPAAPITLSVTAGLSADDVQKLLADDQKRRDDEAKKLAATRTANHAAFDGVIAAAKLPDDVAKQLGEARNLIGQNWTEADAKALAENQVKVGEQIVAARKLSGMGFVPRGSVQSVDPAERNTILNLAEDIRNRMRGTGAHVSGALRLLADDKLPLAAQRALAMFDEQHAAGLHAEAKALASGVVNTGDTALPYSYQREVIREAYSDTNILALVSVATDPTTGPTHQIPYEARDVSQIVNDGIVYEGAAIPRAGVSQALEPAYIVPMKIAMELTNEVRFFSANNAQINWDAAARNLESNARYFRELKARRIANLLQRSADAYGAIAVSNEAFDARLTGSQSIIKTTNFPIVRPFQARDLQGNAIGSPENPITITLNGVAISEYNGTGTQAAGTYWRITDANLGYIQLVDQAGTAVTPTDTGTNTISYSYATNIVKVDSDVGSSTYEKRMTAVVQAIGARKALLRDDRYVDPNYLLMSGTLHNMVTDAEVFQANNKRADASINAFGDLEPIKGIPAVSTNAPSIDLGDSRILIGQRGLMANTIAKAFSVGEPYEIFDSNGRPLGKKGAYGEEYASIHLPTAYRPRHTSVIVYSATARTAA